jgi:predicted dehydrogenase
MDRNQQTTNQTTLAMVGMVEGNGHPYSWSAIVNGYNPEKMADCPYSVIPEYLSEQPLEEVSISGASVTHIWTDDSADAESVAAAAKIPNIADEPTDVIGEVDGIIIPTDDGNNHVSRVKPFLDSDLPIFVDKPLATTVDDLRTFIDWHKEGYSITSSSALRYAPEVDSLGESVNSLGQIRWITNATHHTWTRYGIHRIEPIVRLLGPGFELVECFTDGGTETYTITHQGGFTITIGVRDDLRGGSGRLTVYGTSGDYTIDSTDTYTTFRRQLQSVIEFMKTSKPDVPFEETVDLMACIIAGRWSKNENRSVHISEVYNSLPMTPP